ncbi:MAG: hypothetical protein HC903_27090 [Methylacidiphilales bacterium]|nr:hypothetical protein [Candidatus Methylacidiphilales bacterium]NJR16666.1 hypothetical protein [Calothrix sp. CSU_2_0]
MKYRQMLRLYRFWDNAKSSLIDICCDRIPKLVPAILAKQSQVIPKN